MAELFTCHGQRAYTVMDGTKKAYRIVAALGDENGLVEVNDDDYRIYHFPWRMGPVSPTGIYKNPAGP